MIDSLRNVRLGRGAVCAVALLAAAATALVVSTGLRHTDAQTAVLAALRQRPLVIRPAAARPAASSPAVAPSPGPASDLTPASSPAAPATRPAASSSPGSGPAPTAAVTTTNTVSTSASSTSPAAPAQKVHHVFLIALSATSFDQAFGQSSPATYLNHTLVPEGTLLGGYQTLGRAELPDLLAMVSGQAPNSDTELDCPSYAEFPSGTNPDAHGQVPGTGCVYPNTITTIADQFTSQGETWKAYVEGIGRTPCVHPNSDATDSTPLPGAGQQCDTRHNPFIYFHSLLDLGGCTNNDLSLDQLPRDLGSAQRTPNYSFITPGLCADAAAATCADGRGVGVGREDAFLKRWVPRILASQAYKRDGVLIVAFTSTSPTPVTGGAVPSGALVLSRYAARGQVIAATYDPYSLLRSIEELFGFTPLAHAATAKSFAAEALPGA
jgi:hypothetical protein